MKKIIGLIVLSGFALMGAEETEKEFFAAATPGSASAEIVVDRTTPAKFGGEKARLKVDERKVKHQFVAGIVEAESIRGFELAVFLWKGLPERNPQQIIQIESSADGKEYRKVTLKSVLAAKGEFHKFILSNNGTLPEGTRYLRVSISLKRIDLAWAAQIGKIRLLK